MHLIPSVQGWQRRRSLSCRDRDRQSSASGNSVKSINVIQAEPESKKFRVKDIGGESGVGAEKVSGTIDDEGSQIGHRHRSGEKRNAQPTGRRGFQKDRVQTRYEPDATMGAGAYIKRCWV